MAGLKTHGITQDTPQNILLGAGTFYKNLVYDDTAKAWQGTVLGATSGGGTLKITPEYLRPDIDGATVAVKGMIWKVADVATIEANLTEFTENILADVLHLAEDPNTVTGYRKLVAVRNITEGNYLNNIAYVGTLTSGKQIIVILPNAICLGALEMSPKNKENATYAVTFECTATFEQDDLEHLPYEIYYPSGA